MFFGYYDDERNSVCDADRLVDAYDQEVWQALRDDYPDRYWVIFMDGKKASVDDIEDLEDDPDVAYIYDLEDGDDEKDAIEEYYEENSYSSDFEFAPYVDL